MPLLNFMPLSFVNCFLKQNKLAALGTVTQNAGLQFLGANTAWYSNCSRSTASSRLSLQSKLKVLDLRRKYQSKTTYKASLSQSTSQARNKPLLHDNLATNSFKWLFSPMQISCFFLGNRPRPLKAHSKFAIKLRELRKIRSFYGNLSLKYLKKVIKKSGYSSAYQRDETILTILESRLDIVLYRSGFFESVVSSKQWVLHSGVYINQKKVTSPSVSIMPGDIVSLLPNNSVSKQTRFRNNLVACAETASGASALASASPTHPMQEPWFCKAKPEQEVMRMLHSQEDRKQQFNGNISSKHCHPSSTSLIKAPRRSYYREKSGVSYLSLFSFKAEQMPCFTSCSYKVDNQPTKGASILKNQSAKQLKRKQKKWRFKASPFRAALLRSSLKIFNKSSKRTSCFIEEWIKRCFSKTGCALALQRKSRVEPMQEHTQQPKLNAIETFVFSKNYWLSSRQSFSVFDGGTKRLDLSHSLFSQFAFDLKDELSKLKGVNPPRGLIGLQAKQSSSALLREQEQAGALVSYGTGWDGMVWYGMVLQSKTKAKQLVLCNKTIQSKAIGFVTQNHTKQKLMKEFVSQPENQEKKLKLNLVFPPEKGLLYDFLFLSYLLFLKKEFLFSSSRRRKTVKTKERQNRVCISKADASASALASPAVSVLPIHRVNMPQGLMHGRDCRPRRTGFIEKNQNQSKAKNVFRFKSLPFYLEKPKKEKAACFEKQKTSFFYKDQFFFASKKVKPLHLEISYKSLSTVFLFNPQRICFPFFINVSQIYK